MGSEVECSEVKISGEMYTLSLIYSYVAICRFCVIHCVIIICFPLLFSNYSTFVFNILFKLVFLFCIFVFFLCILYFYCFVYYCSFSINSCSFTIFVLVYRTLPPGGEQLQ